MGSWTKFPKAHIKQIIVIILTCFILLFYCSCNKIETFGSSASCPDCVGNNTVSLNTLLTSAACSPGDVACEANRAAVTQNVNTDQETSTDRADAAAMDSTGGPVPLKASPGEPVWHFSNYRPFSRCDDCRGLAYEVIGAFPDPADVPAAGAWPNKNKRVKAASRGYITSVATSDNEGRKNDYTPDINWVSDFCLKDPDCLGMQVNKSDGTARMVTTIKPLVREDPEQDSGQTTEDGAANFHDMYILHPYRAIKWQLENKKITAPFRARVRKLMNVPNDGNHPRHDDWDEHDSENVLGQLERAEDIGNEKDLDQDGVVTAEEAYQWEILKEQDTNKDDIASEAEKLAWNHKKADTNNDGTADAGELSLWEQKKELLKMRREEFGQISDTCRNNFTDACINELPGVGTNADVVTSNQDRTKRSNKKLKAENTKQARAIIEMLGKELTKHNLNASAQAVVNKHAEIKAWEAWVNGVGLAAKNHWVSAAATAQVGYNGALNALNQKNAQKTNLTNYYNEAVQKVNDWEEYRASSQTHATDHHNAAVWWRDVNGPPTWGTAWSLHMYNHYNDVLFNHVNNTAGEYQTALNGLKAVNQTYATGEHVYVNGTNGGKGWGKTSNANNACIGARNQAKYNGFRDLINGGHLPGKTLNDILKCKVTTGHFMNNKFNRRKYHLIRQDGVLRRELGRAWRTKLMHQGKRPTTNKQCGYNQRSQNGQERKNKCGDCYQDDTAGCKNTGPIGPAANQYWKTTYWQNVVATWHGRYKSALNQFNHHIGQRNHWNGHVTHANNKKGQWQTKVGNREPGMNAAVAAASLAQQTFNWHHTNLVNHNNAKTNATNAYNNGVNYLAAINVQKATYKSAYDTLKGKVDNIKLQINTELDAADLTEADVADIYTPMAPASIAKTWTGDGCVVGEGWHTQKSNAKNAVKALCNDKHGSGILAMQGHQCDIKPGSQQQNSNNKYKYTACPFPG